MKPIFLFTTLILIMQQLKAQNIDNPSFDSVYIGGIDRIHSWITSDAWPVTSGDTVHPLNPNDHYQSVGLQYHETYRSVQIEYSNAFAGPYAIKLLSETGRVDIFGNPFRGFVVNGNHFYTDSAGYLDLKKCGTPFPYRPDILRGHYKLEDNSPSLHNYPEAIVLLKKYNPTTQTSDTIGYAIANMQFMPTTSWLLFELPINYLSSQVPDSIVVAFFSPPLGNLSTLWVDSLGFEYSTPSVINENKDEEKIYYQNRVENKIYLLNTEKIQSVKFYDVNGRVVLEETSYNAIIDISGLAKGNYLMNIKYKNNKYFVFKIIK